ncbi:histone-lysine N-methyltransferase set1 isoform X1 [Patella vulgata]|uniref:histone-lysine N-methyltransferase set1 isoform X1 n=1 Tax=Patella vulgata TaxID=6465 RepID=UPI002180171F|nr:histone-lysine N-methyltransferase set1 isoform X1 [Patella vulgata]
MASSSVSQESLDLEDFENQAKRNRIRTHRGRGMVHRSAEREGSDQYDTREQNGDNEKENNCSSGLVQPEHDSPTRGAASRLKDKRTRPNHLHKGKLPKDKRKLREKRRSTGVVHLPSTESTGDSLDDDDDTDNKASSETKKNTTFNEGTSVDGGVRHPEPHKHSHHHTSHIHSSYTNRRNKSPSDLEADLEDNQDYDSTVSQSETNLTLIGQSEPSDMPVNQMPVSSSSTSGVLKYTRYTTDNRTSSVAPPSSNVPEPDSKTTSSTTAEILSRYRDSEYRQQRETESPKKDIEGPRPFTTYSQLRENRGDISYGSYLSRLRDRDSTTPVHQRINYHMSPRPFVNKQSETTANLEKLLDKEKDENKKLKEIIDDKDRRIAELEKEVFLLNKELDELDEDNIKLQEQNSALIKAMSTLNTAV